MLIHYMAMLTPRSLIDTHTPTEFISNFINGILYKFQSPLGYIIINNAQVYITLHIISIIKALIYKNYSRARNELDNLFSLCDLVEYVIKY